MVLDLYILRLWSKRFIGILSIVLGVLLLGRILKVLDASAGQGVAGDLLSLMLMAILPYFLVLTVPIAFFFATQGMLLRLHQDSELDALRAAGLSYARILRPLTAMAILCCFCLGFTSLQLMPQGVVKFQSLLHALQSSKTAPSFIPQRFNQQIEGLTLYIGGMNDAGVMQQVFLEDHREADLDPVVYIAESAQILKEGSVLQFRLFQGVRLEGKGAELRTLQFDRYQVGLDAEALGLLRIPVVAKGLVSMQASALWQQAMHDDKARLELSRRLTLPLMVLILFVFSMPMSLAAKRSSSYSVYVFGLALVMLTYNLHIMLHQKAMLGVLPWWSLWCGVLFLALVAAWLWRRASQDRLPGFLLNSGVWIRHMGQQCLALCKRQSRSSSNP